MFSSYIDERRLLLLPLRCVRGFLVMKPGTASSGLSGLILSALYIRGAEPPRRGGEAREGDQLADDDDDAGETSLAWLFPRECRGRGAVGDEVLEDELGSKLTLRRPAEPALRRDRGQSDDDDEGWADGEEDSAMMLLGMPGPRDGESRFEDDEEEMAIILPVLPTPGDGEGRLEDGEEDSAMTLSELPCPRDGEGILRDDPSEEKSELRRPLLGPPYSRVGAGQSEDDEEGVRGVNEVAGLLPGLLPPCNDGDRSDPEDNGSTILRLLPG